MSWLERLPWPRAGGRHRVGLGGDRLCFGAARATDHRDSPHAELRLDAGSDTPSWPAALRALGAELGRPAADAGRPARGLDVVLAGCYVRWKLLELPRGLDKDSERQALARHLFRDSLGDDAAHWRVQVVEQPAGWPAPACAVDGRLLDQLAAVCADARIAPARVRPYFAAAFDYWRARLPGHSYWFAVADGSSISLGLLRDGRWAGLNVRPASGRPAAQIAAMQAQLALPAGIEAAQLPLHLVAPGELANGAQADLGAAVRRLAPPAQWSDGAVRCRLAYGI